ncbi:MAG: polyphosphate kinase 1 [Bacteroidales bacterium]|jgi:polyphosphate kinase|nr:polyphosphate kinase 1 [Bacteroidales bacterium]
MMRQKYVNREISWLSFNDRVLQEAQDKSVPILQRLRFLGIFSNNMDEFFRVRVATIKRIVAIGNKEKAFFGNQSAKDILNKIQRLTQQQQKKFEKIYQQLITELEQHNVYVVNERQLTPEQGHYVKEFYNENIRPVLVPIMLHEGHPFPELKDKPIYFAVKLSDRKDPKRFDYALLDLSTDILPRFVILPSSGKKKYIIILDDIIRYCINDVFSIFEYDTIEAYNIKITRDAELDIDDDISKSFMEKISLSLEKRKKGEPVRFVYDEKMPEDLLQFFIKKMKLDEDDNIIAGGKYHNFKDFINFPKIGPKRLEKREMPPVPHPYFKHHKSILNEIKKRDQVLHYPYQSFSYFIDMIREAAIDPQVVSIQITLYRAAKKSMVINSLLNAARNGKKVVVLIELQARFDEEANIYWSNKMQESGIKVIHGVPGLKVHGKVCLITRKNKNKLENFAYIGTGNFQEVTAKLYCDEGLFTYDQRITAEVEKVFEFFDKNYKQHIFEHIILSPFITRKHFIRLIENEMVNAREGKKAFMILKLNSLVDEEMIDKLYEASQKGVQIKLIVRSACSLKAGVKGLSENIEVISIVDRYLEHSRILYFYQDGKELMYISSADWMVRNLDNRIEISCPVYDEEIKKELKQMLKIQWKDNVKARIIDEKQVNQYKKNKKPKLRAQIAYYQYIKRRYAQIKQKDQ